MLNRPVIAAAGHEYQLHHDFPANRQVLVALLVLSVLKRTPGIDINRALCRMRRMVIADLDLVGFRQAGALPEVSF